MKVVFDTNVWVSGLVFKGEVRKLLQMALEEEIQPVISVLLLRELEKVLLNPKIGYEISVATAVVHQVQMLCQVVHPAHKIHAIQQDPADNMVLECALEGKVDFIVSGDKHLLNLGAFQGIPIMTPGQFSQRMKIT
jgi:uncharacterized protein